MHVVAVVGPTAVGKSATAIALAGRLAPRAVEIINADAMQSYQGMDVGTAKVGPTERLGVPHHMLDIWPVTHRASVVEYRDAARTVIGDVLGRGGMPVVVGGSGLYISAALDDMAVPATEPAVRARYEDRLAAEGAAALHAELAVRDPEAAAAIDPANGRRLVRALEVVELQGAFRARLPRDPEPWVPAQWFGLTAPLPQLDEAIDARVAAMWESGLVAEVRALADRGLRDGPTAAKAVGYAECLAFLAGELTRHEAIAATALRTRQLARRQLRWFRRNRRIAWLDVDLRVPARDAAAQTASRIVTMLDAPA